MHKTNTENPSDIPEPFYATLVKKESYPAPYGNYSSATFTPYYFIGPDGIEHFICNLVTRTNDPYRSDASQRRQIAHHLRSLRKNGYRCLRFHGRREDPFAFLEWLKQHDYTLEIQGELFDFSDRNWVDFHGNVVEYSAAFMYRIYDREYLAELLQALHTVKRHHAWKRTPDKKQGQ